MSVTAAQKRHRSTVASLGCIACRNVGYPDSPAEIHHPRFSGGTSMKSDESLILPLCPIHHRTGGYGRAIHAGRHAWERTHGTEQELVEQVKELLR